MPQNTLAVREQFDDLEQQQETARTGMWLFVATEIMFFGGLFMAYAVYHLVYPGSFGTGGRYTNLLLGSINTALLLTSGLTMALGVNAIQRGRLKACVMFLVLTAALGVAFLAVKGIEYAEDIHRHLWPGPSFALPGAPASEMFFYLYWIMTAVHALHLIVGIGLLAVMAFLVSRGRFSPACHTPIELAGLYWGFVDIIWLYLYPLLYLIDRNGQT